MPPRLCVAVIVLFWLGMNGWLIHREVWPQWRAGDPPPYTIDLTQELGKETVNWEVRQKDARIGDAVSEVARQHDRSYKLRTYYRFDKLRILSLDIRKLIGTYHVTEEGDLLGLDAQVTLQQNVGKRDQPLMINHEFEMRGQVVGGQLLPEFFYNKEKLALGEIKVPVEGRGGALNPLHPLNRLPGLSAGRHWRIALFDPLGADLGKALGPQFQELFAAVEGMAIPFLNAEVKLDHLAWNDEDVTCFKIEYRKPGEPDLVAATWVRRRDGLVLQQFSRHEMMEMTLRRVPAR